MIFWEKTTALILCKRCGSTVSGWEKWVKMFTCVLVKPGKAGVNNKKNSRPPARIRGWPADSIAGVVISFQLEDRLEDQLTDRQ